MNLYTLILNVEKNQTKSCSCKWDGFSEYFNTARYRTDVLLWKPGLVCIESGIQKYTCISKCHNLQYLCLLNTIRGQVVGMTEKNY